MRRASKTNRIKAEIKRLTAIFEGLDTSTLAGIEDLINRAAYMRATLEDYEVDLDAGGYVEKFTQSINTPPFDRERPVARLYNAMNKNYQSITKILADSIPAAVPEDAGAEINKFLGRGK